MVFGFNKKAHEAGVVEVTDTNISNEDNLEASHAIQASGIEVQESVQNLKKFKKLHKWDPNLPIEQYDNVTAVLDTGDIEKEVAIEQALLEENSPYPEVAAAVRNYDEVSLVIPSFHDQI